MPGIPPHPAASLVAEVMAQPEPERLDYALGLLALLDAADAEALMTYGPLGLTSAEARVLAALVAVPGHLWPAAALAARINPESDGTSAPVHVHQLRRKLAALGQRGAISSIRGEGYYVRPEAAAGIQALATAQAWCERRGAA